jgi:hypothetical protein
VCSFLRNGAPARRAPPIYNTRCVDDVKRRVRPGVIFLEERDAHERCRAPILFLKEAPVLDPRSEYALPYRIRKKPAGGPSPARASLPVMSETQGRRSNDEYRMRYASWCDLRPLRLLSNFMRSWRRSNAPVCQSGIGSASLPERTNFSRSCGVNSKHSGLLIRTVRVRIPPAPPNFHFRESFQQSDCKPAVVKAAGI